MIQIPGTTATITITFSPRWPRTDDPAVYGLEPGELVRYSRSGLCFVVEAARRVRSRDGSNRWRVIMTRLGRDAIDDAGTDDVLELD